MFLDSVSHMGAGGRRRCCGCWCGRDHGLGCPVGMSGSGMGMLLGSRTATPQVFCGAVRCPCVVAGPGWLVGSCGAWWFENWIVDASKRN